MFIQQLYTNCLAQAAYYIESNGEAAIIDPLRDIDPYIQLALERKATIKYVFETHFHADFVSGHVDLANKTGATIVYGPTAMPFFNALIAKDEQVFRIGSISLKVLHTPGHTMESCCYLLLDESGKEIALFSGDTVFLGDVGRPDLAQEATQMTQEELAGLLYDSIQSKILPLPDDITIYPAHGAGSACGKQMSQDRQDTLGHQKQVNYALQQNLTRDEFIGAVITGLTRPPQYFPQNAAMNKSGYSGIDEILKKGMTALTVQEFEQLHLTNKAAILDVRAADDFANGFIPGSVNIGIDGNFAPWVGTVIQNINTPLLLVAEESRVQEAVTRLARVGYDNCLGYLQGGISSWIDAGKPMDTIENISAESLSDKLEITPNAVLLDVRRQNEFDAEHVTGVKHIPLEFITEYLAELDKDSTYYVYCAGGYRSMIFISILKANSFDKLVNIRGGFATIRQNGRLFITHHQDVSLSE